jgi:hypothetical protein
MSYDTTAPIPGWPPAQPAQPAPPAPRRWRVRPRWALAAGGVALVALVAGLLVWQPWNPPPNAPTAIHVVSPTATSVDVSWTASKGGAKPDHYIVFRDGKQAGVVPASQTSWTDNGLTPGSSHEYTVEAQGGGQQSGPSTKAAVTTITPPPVKLAVSQVTYTSEVLTWSPSPQGPQPDQYTIYDGTNSLGTVTGTTDSYALSGLTPGSNHQLTVTAHWGSATSGPAPALTAPALSPPLQGSVPLQFKTVSIPSGSSGITNGEHWSDTWQFSPTCSGSSCTMVDNGEFAPPNLGSKTFTVKLSPSGGGYSGSGTAKVTNCGGTAVTNTITLSLAPNSGGVAHGGWNAWHGTMQLSSPYIQVSSTNYCPQQSWQFNLSGSGS